MIPDKITASEARLLRKELAKATKPKKVRKPAGDSVHTRKLKKADNKFSLFCRATWADEQGAVRCCTCGAWKLWKMPDASLHCGHWQSRGYGPTRFDFHNVGPQCVLCNRWKEGEKSKMEIWLRKTYGDKKTDRVLASSKTHRNLDDFELDAIAAEFKAKFEQVKRQKGL